DYYCIIWHNNAWEF
nr:immunoglobulin light chain junction region [Macaca mulatta]